jgi:isoleucyl-tRNA synthetase
MNERFDKILWFRGVVNQALETVRQERKIAKSLEAAVLISGDDEIEALLRRQQELAALLVVSQAEVGKSSNGRLLQHVGSGPMGKVVVDVMPARGVKCVRCWNYREDVGRNPAHPELCGRCSSVMELQ